MPDLMNANTLHPEHQPESRSVIIIDDAFLRAIERSPVDCERTRNGMAIRMMQEERQRRRRPERRVEVHARCSVAVS